MGEAPRLSGASARAFGVALVRLALAAAGIAGAAARGLDALPTLGATAVGAVGLALIAAGKASRPGRTNPEPLPVPAGASYDPPWMGALLACVPSTLGVGLMMGVALTFSPALAALLAGVELAMGVLALVAGAQLAGRERSDGVRYWLERGPAPRLFVSPRRS